MILGTTKVEVRLTKTATARFDVIRNAVHEFITTSFVSIWPSTALDGWEAVPKLESSVERIYVSESPCPDRSIPIPQANLQIHVFQPYPDEAYDECTGGGDGEEEVVSATVSEMPSRGLEGLWESLVYPDGVKSKLLDYIYATISFSDADVDCTDPLPSLQTIMPDYMRPILVFQSTSCRGTEWFSSTDLQGLGKPLYAELSLRNSQFDLPTGTQSSTPTSHPTQNTKCPPLAQISPCETARDQRPLSLLQVVLRVREARSRAIRERHGNDRGREPFRCGFDR